MKFTVITLFPELIESVFSSSIMRRAQDSEKIEITTMNLRHFGIGPHRSVDDKPYGGGTGMILRVDVVEKAIKKAKKGLKKEKVILLTPSGKPYSQETAENFSKLEHLILVCGRYEGFDERVRNYVDEEISIGDYVLSGGEIAAMAVIESTARLIKGVIPKGEATKYESFAKTDQGRRLEHPQYTRPEKYDDKQVPEILLSGDHQAIDEWRSQQSEKSTKENRPDLI